MKKQHVELSATDKTRLKTLISRGSLKRRALKRATALLELGQGKTFKEVSEAIKVSGATVSAWADRYKKEGLDFLADKPRPGRPKDITAQQRKKIAALARSDAPDGYERWTLRLLAEKAVEFGYVKHISHQYINQILKQEEPRWQMEGC